MRILGIDIGGTGIKAAPVDVDTGMLCCERVRRPTPDPSTPEAVADVVLEIVRQFEWDGPIGCAFPAPIKGGIMRTAANVDKAWVGVNGERLIGERTQLPVRFINDADAAGIAEMEFGAGRGQTGVVMLLTLGTGIGSAIFVNGVLLPNTELGHLPFRGRDVEAHASDRVRKEKDLDWPAWAGRLNDVLSQFEFLFYPDLFIIGGGVSRKYDKFLPLLHTEAKVVPAQMLNDAGIVGAALAAREPRPLSLAALAPQQVDVASGGSVS
ncbi:MAG: polyphosphate--glucose phosphotransferase [Anaerolineae bacterium]